MSRWKLCLASLGDLWVALLIGGVLATPVMLMHGMKRTFSGRYTCATAPADDRELRKWYESQRGVEELEVKREGGSLTVSYARRSCVGKATVGAPPWDALGYQDVKRQSHTWGFAMNMGLAAGIQSLPVVIAFSQIGLLIVGVRRLRKIRARQPPADRELPSSARRAVLLGLATGAAMLLFGVLHAWGLKALFGRLSPSTQMWSAIADAPTHIQAAILAGGVIAAPICEEIFFRGAMFGLFVSEGHMGLGVAVSTVCFAAGHIDPYNQVAYVVLGLILAWLYYRTRSLLACIVAHAVNNGVAFGLLLMGQT